MNTKKFISFRKDGKPIEKDFPLQRNQKEQIEFEKQLFETAGWQPADAVKIQQPKKQTREELLALLAETEREELKNNIIEPIPDDRFDNIPQYLIDEANKTPVPTEQPLKEKRKYTKKQ